MEPVLGVALLWLLFGGTHIGLAAGRIRGPLVARLGEGGFKALFSFVAAASFVVLVRFYAAHRTAGIAGLAVGDVAVVRGVVMSVVVTGVALLTTGLAVYPRLPMALFGPSIRGPRGVERITRHPFFAGTALVALAHVLLATRLVGAVFAGGLALIATAGARRQDAKLLRVRGRPYAEYLSATSAVPFAAILSGRQRLVWRELPLGALAAGLALAFTLRAVHGAIFAQHGTWIIAAVLGGAAIATLQSWRRARRLGAAVAVHS